MSLENWPQAETLAAYVRVEWATWFDEPAPRLNWVLQGTGRPVAQTSVMLLAIEAGTGEPRLVAKVNRDRAMGGITENEFSRQKEAHTLLPESVARPLGLVNVAGDLHLITEYAPSTLAWVSGAAGWRRDREAELVGWLATLHDTSQRARSGSDANLVTDVRAAFVERFPISSRTGERLAEATDMVLRDSLESRSEILVHGDFWSGNWLFDDGDFTVIDWEHARWRLSPVLDEFMHPLSELTRQELPNPTSQTLARLSHAYREQRGIATRSNEDCVLASIWTAAEVATRTHRRWGVVEDWSHVWVRLTESLAEMHENA